MAITQLVYSPNSITKPTTFNGDMDGHLGELPTMIDEMNATAAAMTAIAAGGAVSLQYTFSTATADADPGAGTLRLDNATQNTSTAIRIDLVGSDGSTLTGVLDLLDDSSSANKGYLTLRSAIDPTKWLVFAVSALASPSGYRNVAVACVASSAANPFADGDDLLFDFTPNGDKGDTGATGDSVGLAYAYSTTVTATDPGAGIVQFNNAALASATALYISETDGAGNAIAAEIATWDDATGTNKAKLKIHKTGDPTKFALFNITGTNTDNGTWDTINVTYVAGAGALSNADPVRIEVARNGDTGAAGSTPTTLKVSDQKASLVDGGSSSAGSITQRTLNTVEVNTIAGASLASSTITLPAGTYDVFARAPALRSGRHQLVLYNSTDAAYTLIGANAWSDPNDDGQCDSTVVGQFTIASAKNFQLRHFTQTAYAGAGLGSRSSSGQVEVYAEAFFKKVA